MERSRHDQRRKSPRELESHVPAIWEEEQRGNGGISGIYCHLPGSIEEQDQATDGQDRIESGANINFKPILKCRNGRKKGGFKNVQI